MRDCEKYAELISLAVDGEIGEDDGRALSAHLSACPDCRRIFNAFIIISDGLLESIVEPPEALARDVMLKISASAARKRPWARVAGLAALAACCALIIYAGVRFMPLTKGAGGGSAAAPPMMAAMQDNSVAESYEGESYAAPAGEARGEAEDSGKLSGSAEPLIPASTPAPAGAGNGRVTPEESGESEVFLFSADRANLYSNFSADAPEPVLTAIGKETLDALFDLLGFSPADTFNAAELEPMYILEVIDGENGGYEIFFWIIDGFIFSNDIDGNYYVAACNLDSFLSFIEESVSQ